MGLHASHFIASGSTRLRFVSIGAKAGRRALPVLHFAIAVLLLTCVWAFVPASQAHAYVDPSVMTYTIQAVAGLAVALSAVIGVLFRRTRRKLYEWLKIDENAGKVSEPDVARIDPASLDSGKRLAQASDAARNLAAESDPDPSRRAVRDIVWKARFLFAFAASFFAVFTLIVAPALEIFGSNADSLVFGLQVVWWVPATFGLAIALALALALSSLKRRPFYLAVMFVFLVGVAAYVQSLFLNQGMMPADGGFIGWDEPYFTSKMWFSGIVWALVIAVPLAASLLRQHTSLKIATALACVLVCVQLVGVASVAVDSSANAVSEQGKPYVTQGGLLSVASQNNVVEFILDTYDTAILDQIIEEDPDYLQNFPDFTYFHNSTGTMIPTSNAIPNMLTQLKPEPGQDVADYRRTKYEKSTFIGDIRDQGYSIGIYTDSLMADFNNDADRRLADMTVNIHPVNHAPMNVWETFVVTTQCSLYREAPWVLKPFFWYYTSDLNNRMIADGDSTNLNDSLYELDDAAIRELIEQRGLEVDAADPGAYRFIHLFGPHFPFSIDEEGENVGTNQSDQVSQAKGSMRTVFAYLDALRERGLYNDTTIIVTADHGVWDITQDPVSAPISPIILVKPSHTEGHEPQPATRSEIPVSHDDLQPTVIDAMGLDASKYGKTVFALDDQQRIRTFDALTNVGDEGQRFVEYSIDGDVLDLSCWSKTGNVWLGA